MQLARLIVVPGDLAAPVAELESITLNAHNLGLLQRVVNDKAHPHRLPNIVQYRTGECQQVSDSLVALLRPHVVTVLVHRCILIAEDWLSKLDLEAPDIVFTSLHQGALAVTPVAQLIRASDNCEYLPRLKFHLNLELDFHRVERRNHFVFGKVEQESRVV